MSETPRTDAAVFTTGSYPGEDVVNHTVARELERELAAMTAERDQAMLRLANQDDHNTALQARIADLESRERALREALRRLTFAARTSGGTAGRDEDLCAACDEAERLLLTPNPEA